jgi:hypothetical protein
LKKIIFIILSFSFQAYAADCNFKSIPKNKLRFFANPRGRLVAADQKTQELFESLGFGPQRDKKDTRQPLNIVSCPAEEGKPKTFFSADGRFTFISRNSCEEKFAQATGFAEKPIDDNYGSMESGIRVGLQDFGLCAEEGKGFYHCKSSARTAKCLAELKL